MNPRKIQVWLRPDQIECVLDVLEFSSATIRRDLEHQHYPTRNFASKLARDRISEAAVQFRAAIAKAEGRS